MNMVKVWKMMFISIVFGNKIMISKVKDSMKRISEVNDMMVKCEIRLVLCVIKYYMIFLFFKKKNLFSVWYILFKFGLFI